jgi:hypothetical protein
MQVNVPSAQLPRISSKRQFVGTGVTVMAQSEVRRSSIPSTMHDWMRQFMDRPRRWLDDFSEEAFAEVTLDNGVRVIRIPKSEKSVGHRIEVKS